MNRTIVSLEYKNDVTFVNAQNQGTVVEFISETNNIICLLLKIKYELWKKQIKSIFNYFMTRMLL